MVLSLTSMLYQLLGIDILNIHLAGITRNRWDVQILTELKHNMYKCNCVPDGGGWTPSGFPLFIEHYFNTCCTALCYEQ